jgi:Mg/Co/Ni transporter MgtE
MATDQVIAAYRKVSEDAAVLDYIYVVDHEGRLHGVVNLPELLRANRKCT